MFLGGLFMNKNNIFLLLFLFVSMLASEKFLSIEEALIFVERNEDPLT